MQSQYADMFPSMTRSERPGIDVADFADEGDVTTARILLLLGSDGNRRLLGDWLGQKYEVILPEAAGPLTEPFDLAIVDGVAVELWGHELRTAKHAAEPVFLPYLLLASRRQVQFVGRHVGQTVDELLRTPIDPAELRTRVEILLRMRQQSHALKQHHDELEALLDARGDVE